MADVGVFTIGELARRTGLTTRTIRFYSDEGLLPPADRTHAGYRLYDAASLARLELLRTLRELGLSLPDAEAALAGRASVSDLATRHVALLDEQIEVLRIRRAVLRAVVKTGAELDEVGIMKDLAAMTDEERSRLIDEFWDEVNAGLNINPDFDAGMRSAKPLLPDDPSPEQLRAWMELAELVRDKDFRQRVRQMSESHSEAREAGESMAMPDAEAQEKWYSWIARAADLKDAGEAPDSVAAGELVAEVAAGMNLTVPAAAEHIAVGTDTRAERYWQLMATINGWAPVPTQVPAVEWLVAALRAAA